MDERRWDSPISMWNVRRLLLYLPTEQLTDAAAAAGIPEARYAGGKTAAVDEVLAGMFRWRHDERGNWIE